jgi:hypothetical protein
MKPNLLTIAAVLSTLIGSAQATPAETPTTQTPTKIKVYTPGSSFSSKSTKKDNSYKWTIKTDVVAILTGEFPLIAEYRFAPKFSFEASAGATYAYYSNDGFLEDDTFFGDGSKAGIGNAFRGTIKFYPSADYDALEGWSIGIQLYTKTTNRLYEESTVSTSWSQSSTMYTDSKTKNGISLILSKQVFVDSNITAEYFFGVGLANITREQPASTYDSSGKYSGIEMQKTSVQQPNFQFGTRIGFGN